MTIKDLKEKALATGFSVEENGEFLTVNYALLVSNRQPGQTSGPWDYVAFGPRCEVIAIGHEDGNNRCGGWTWIRNRMDQQFGNLARPPDVHMVPFLSLPLVPQDGLHIVDDVVSIDSSPPYKSAPLANFFGGQWSQYAQYKYRDAQGFLIDANGHRIALP